MRSLVRFPALGQGEHKQRAVEAQVQARVLFRQDACRDRRCCGQEHGCANHAASERWRGHVCTSCWRRVGGSCENSHSADFAHRSLSHVRRFRRRPAACARGRLVDRVRGTHHECEMFVRTVQDVIVVSGTLISRVLRFESSLGFVGTAANLTCFGDLLRYLGNCCGFVGTTVNAFCCQKLRRYVEDCHCIVGATANPFCS